jgi:hypothetical protein
MDEETGIFQKPLVKRLLGFAAFIAVYLLIGVWLQFVDGKTDQAFNMIIDVGICVVGMIGWMVFFAQFVLPVKHLRDRYKVVERLVTYLMGGNGAAIFIENGLSYEREGEGRKNGPGLVWLDSASAAVLRTSGRFTRTIGPGIHFTNYGETIAATADLHTLTQSIGPFESDEPFRIGTGDANYKAVRERAEVTNAMTRDGIAVCASISVTFRIKSIPGEGSTRFGFNAANTEAAIRDSMTRGVDLKNPLWNSLPARMAADVWREYLGKFRFNELFEKNEDHPDTTIQFINEMIKKRLTKAQVESLDAYGQVVLENPSREVEYRNLIKAKNRNGAENLLVKLESIEHAKLAEMGMEVKGVTIKKLFFAPEIEEKLVSQWTALWLQNAQKERDQVEVDRKLYDATGQQEGLKKFALDACREILQKSPTDATQALGMLTHATFRAAQRNPRLLNRINSADMRNLFEISSSLKNQQGPTE